MARQNSSSGASTAVLSAAVEPPALLCSTWSAPNLSTVARIARSRLSGSLTSVGIAIAPLPARCAVSSPAPGLISAIATRAPSRAKRIAVARPIPVPAPVISATLPASLGIPVLLVNPRTLVSLTAEHGGEPPRIEHRSHHRDFAALDAIPLGNKSSAAGRTGHEGEPGHATLAQLLTEM